MTFAQFALALSLTESDNNDRAYGDEGLALGRWQMHPAFFYDWMPKRVEVRSSWRDMFEGALSNFWLHYKGEGAPRAAMIFHLGARAVEEGANDEAYAKRFALNSERVLKGEVKA